MSEASTELILFQVGARVFAAQVADVRRIGSPRLDDTAAALEATALGTPFDRGRGLVIDLGEGAEGTLVVDNVLGVRTVAEKDLQPLPALAATCLASGAVTGFALVDESPMVLVDLATLVREELRRKAEPDAPESPDAP